MRRSGAGVVRTLALFAAMVSGATWLGWCWAAALDVTTRTIKRYEMPAETALDDPPFPVPRVHALACAALEARLKPE